MDYNLTSQKCQWRLKPAHPPPLSPFSASPCCRKWLGLGNNPRYLQKGKMQAKHHEVQAGAAPSCFQGS